MKRAAVLSAYDTQLRRGARADGSGATVQTVDGVVRYVAADAGGWSAVVWADHPDRAVIDRQVAFFSGLGRTFEWKTYAHDPVDVRPMLVDAGFVAEDEESLVVAEVAALPTDVALPAGVRLVPVQDAAGIARLVQVHEEVFGTPHGWLGQALLAQLEEAPDSMAAVLAVAGERAVCSARIDFHVGTDFASLWGGGTLPEWRGRGIYRATVAYRAGLAAARGFRYLQVDASPDSRPILQRLGFVQLTTTTPYVWRPPS
jgi:GNAT superfamily N-acetyltransferase